MVKLSPQAETVLQDLQCGFVLTSVQARSLYGVKNLPARIAELRRAGYCIYSNRKKGLTATFYRLGTPTRRMISNLYYRMGGYFFSR